jgi:hypothetical protein
MNNWQQGLSTILGQQAANQLNVAQTNAGNVQTSSLANAGRAGQIQDQMTQASSTQGANNVENNSGNIQTTLKGYGIDAAAGKGVSNARARDLINAYQNAPAGSPQQTKAYNDLQNYEKNAGAINAAFPKSGKNPVTTNVNGYTIVAYPQNGLYSITGPDGKQKSFNSSDNAKKYLEQQGVYG